MHRRRLRARFLVPALLISLSWGVSARSGIASEGPLEPGKVGLFEIHVPEDRVAAMPQFEDCAGFSIECGALYSASGSIALAVDPEGVLSVDFSDVVIEGPSEAPSAWQPTGEQAVALFLALAEAPGDRVPELDPDVAVWTFDVGALGFGSPFTAAVTNQGRLTISGSRDHRPVDGPSASVFVEADHVPEPGVTRGLVAALLALVLGARSRRTSLGSE